MVAKSGVTIYYKNLYENYEEIFESVKKGLEHYYKSIDNVIRKLKTDNYGVFWEKYTVYRYSIYPTFVIQLKGSLDKTIRLFLPADLESKKIEDYIDSISFWDERYSSLKLSVIKIERLTKSEMEITIKGDNIELSNLSYITIGPEKVKWDLIDKKDSINDVRMVFKTNDGLEITGIGRQSGQLEEYVLQTDELFNNNPHFSLNPKDFQRFHSGSEVWELNYDFVIFKDDDGVLPVSNRYRDKKSGRYIIETNRKIKGILLDEETEIKLNYEELSKKNDEKWIRLKETDEALPEFLDSGTSVIDVFMDMVAGGLKQEIIVKNYRGKAEYKITVYKMIFDEGLLKVSEYPPEKKKIYPPKNDNQLKKQREAVKTLMYRPSPSCRALLKFFQKKSNVIWPKVKYEDQIKEQEWEFLTPINGNLRDGTENQRRFVLKALNTPDIAILEGPPGSGKTTTITELIYQLVKRGKRILLSASTHVAIDNVLEKLLDKYGGKDELFEQGIVPLRIGKEFNVSERILPFQIDNRIEELKAKLNNIGINLQDEAIQKIVIDSSNVVCGTTIGILAYPSFDIKKYVEPEFDYLIIDEASKTTFQQFLVPAINCKKWILAGDIKQLSPYTENLHVRVSLEGELPKSLQRAILLYFIFFFEMARKRIKDTNNLPKFVLFEEKKVIKEFFSYVEDQDKQMRHIKKKWDAMEAYKKTSIAILSSNIDFKWLLEKPTHNGHVKFFSLKQWNFQMQYELYSYDIIFVDKTAFKRYKLNLEQLPITHLFLGLDVDDYNSKKYLARHSFLRHNNVINYLLIRRGEKLDDPIEIRECLSNDLKRSWAGQLAWRLQRIYELENTKNEKLKSYYNASITSLSSTYSGNIKNKINKVAQVYFPSILTALQEGIYKRFKSEEDNNVLTEGMDNGPLHERHEILEYQHRMHEEIAKIPRELFYKQNALKTSSAILADGEREWPIKDLNDFYAGKRYIWIDVRGRDIRNKNINECRVIIEQLDRFIRLVKKNKEREWTVLLLTFYNKQKDFLSEKIRKKYTFVGHSRTHFKIYNVNVLVYTIDKVQGREGDVVFLSMVRNSRLGFMDSVNRINVAITRAKYLQVIVGNFDFFNTCDSLEWRVITNRLFNERSVFVMDTKSKELKPKVYKSRNRQFSSYKNTGRGEDPKYRGFAK